MSMRFTFRKENVLVVFNYATTTNQKISNGNGKIVQTYTYGREQFEFVKKGNGVVQMADFDSANCLDCPFSKSNGYRLGKCYTHKFPQMRGFKAMLGAIVRQYGNWDSIPEIPDLPPTKLVEVSTNNYIRFGSYGEPIFIPVNWMQELTKVCASWTGYTHQWHKQPAYKPYFMASVHSVFEEKLANDMGWRVFTIQKEITNDKNVLCPSDRTTCQKCSLCSGVEGKGKKNIKILYH